VSERALAEVDRILGLGSDADDVLRAVVAALAAEPGVAWAGIVFLESGAPVLGPEAGVAAPTRRLEVPVVYQGTVVGRLVIDGDVEPAVLAGIADRIATHVLLGWDTGGEAWEP
jgi:hypothetical protein